MINALNEVRLGLSPRKKWGKTTSLADSKNRREAKQVRYSHDKYLK